MNLFFFVMIGLFLAIVILNGLFLILLAAHAKSVKHFREVNGWDTPERYQPPFGLRWFSRNRRAKIRHGLRRVNGFALLACVMLVLTFLGLQLPTFAGAFVGMVVLFLCVIVTIDSANVY